MNWNVATRANRDATKTVAYSRNMLSNELGKGIVGETMFILDTLSRPIDQVKLASDHCRKQQTRTVRHILIWVISRVEFGGDNILRFSPKIR